MPAEDSDCSRIVEPADIFPHPDHNAPTVMAELASSFFVPVFHAREITL
jgi:hypothetical protein